MAPGSKPQFTIDLGGLSTPSFSGQTKSAVSTAASSPPDPSSGATGRMGLPGQGALASLNNTGFARLGAGSPSHEQGSRFYPRRLVHGSRRSEPGLELMACS